jgi:Synergist-CTERM protein sorting domain-containing protein
MFTSNGASPTMMNCTFAGNRADFGGRALHVRQSSNPVATNCVFWGNGSALGQIQIENTATLTATYSITDQPGTGNITADPLLGALADNGGPTRTHALLAGSAAVNAGTSTGAPATDQRGAARPQGAGVDIGAFEQGGATPVPVPPSSGGGGCSVGFSPWTLLFLLPLLFMPRR